MSHITYTKYQNNNVAGNKRNIYQPQIWHNIIACKNGNDGKISLHVRTKYTMKK